MAKKSPSSDLAEVARTLAKSAHSNSISPELADAYLAAGLSDADLKAEQQRRQEADVLEVYTLNWPVIQLLMLAAQAGCWRYDARGQIVGLNWGDVDVIANWHQMPLEVRKRLPLAVDAYLKPEIEDK